MIPLRLDGSKVWLDLFEGVLVHGQEGFIPIRLANGKMRHVEWRRRSALPGQFDQVEDFSDGLAAVTLAASGDSSTALVASSS